MSRIKQLHIYHFKFFDEQEPISPSWLNESRKSNTPKTKSTHLSEL